VVGYLLLGRAPAATGEQAPAKPHNLSLRVLFTLCTTFTSFAGGHRSPFVALAGTHTVTHLIAYTQ
jgi:hypothetical protein